MPDEKKSFADPHLLDKIDRLIACNVGEHVDLPQLVVVGDQSSGKSSVLEGLTDLPFPRSSGLCTRFATHIMFRRVPDSGTFVSIIPSPDSSPEHVKRVMACKASIESLDSEQFAVIMTEVQDVMGISADTINGNSCSAFSGDILRVEIRGPNEPHMSVIDVPGIFRGTTQGLTTKADMMLEVLGAHIRREFPKVKLEITKILRSCNERLDSLGPARDTPSEQSKFLMSVATRFSRLVDCALSANYNNGFFVGNDIARLATRVVRRNESFATAMEFLGQTYYFDGQSMNTIETNGDGNSEGSLVSRSETIKQIKNKLTTEGKYNICEVGIHDDLHDILDKPTTVASPNGTNVLSWLSRVYNGSRGFEIGTYDTKLLSATMREQTEHWEGIAYGYIIDVIGMVHEFICASLAQLCPDSRVQTGLKSLLMEDLIQKYKTALANVQFLLRVERTGTPTTMNHYFNENLEKCRQNRMKVSLSKVAINLQGYDGNKFVRLNDIGTTQSMSNGKYMIQDIHDTLQSYYKVARKRFVDNVCRHATDYHLLKGDDSPLQLLCPDLINTLTDTQLEEIGGEDIPQKRLRAMLKKQKEDLEAGRKILR